jgi:arabinose-5-phosphate isomerase
MSMKELFLKSQELINHFFKEFDIDPLEELVGFLKKKKKLLFLTGVGKSGLVAEKIAATLTSTGTRAFYLSPQDSLHGDIGWVQKGDVVLLFSKSGESEEMVSMIPYLRNRGAYLVGFCSNKESRLARACHRTISIPFEQELGPLDMVPTLSTTLQMIIGDVMAVALMEHKEISKDDFARNHPAGRIGKRLTTKVMDIMLKGDDLPIAYPQTKLIDSLVEFTNKRAGCLLIIDDHQKLLGIFTDGDLRRALQKWGPQVMEMTFREMMTAAPRHIDGEMLAFEAMQIMEKDQKYPIMVLPVTDRERKVIGLIKLHDILQSGL